MSYQSALFVYVGVKHKDHDRIKARIVAHGGKSDEIDFPDVSDTCPVQGEIVQKVVASDVLVVYVSKYITDNVCISDAVSEASKKGMKVIVMWLDEEGNESDLGRAVINHADSVMPYSEEDVEEVVENGGTVWKAADGGQFKKRDMGHHTCG
ncbi:hypothetical protein [Halomonas caseinilytica]|uniref:hypothetical protein n=1 Tax=Halomonas caseinilytica TaxID=438744 RepID=UPI0008491F03|nr:hypothetical protein [Halomonas caseinilytica]